MVDYRRKLRSRLLVTAFMGHNVLRMQLARRDRKGVKTLATTPPKSPVRKLHAVASPLGAKPATVKATTATTVM